MQNQSYENEFRLQVHFHANLTHFHNNGFRLKTFSETEAQRNSEMAYCYLASAKSHTLTKGVRVKIWLSAETVLKSYLFKASDELTHIHWKFLVNRFHHSYLTFSLYMLSFTVEHRFWESDWDKYSSWGPVIQQQFQFP